jgi:eukaryotic-like serine/threonine-protein kinase
MEDVTCLPRLCPRCGKTLTDDAPEGLCPTCLLAAATETITHSTLDEALTVTARGATVSRATEMPQLSEGQSWGPYRIGRLLGRGGMGEVHEAEHQESGRRIALKVLRSRLQDADERARFLREGQLAASISHPHTVYIFGSEEIAGVPVISMELLPGGTLKDRVAAEGPLPPAAAVSAVLDIVGGLDAAQAAGILHRDIKPSNCFIDTDGSVKVGDFGLSISTLARDVHGQLATGFEGTPQFAAPEQLRGEPLDVRADIYAVGATLYYLLTGQPPFDARDLRELVARVSSEPPPSPRALRREIPSGLAAVIVRCLAKAPAQRPPSYPALAELLRPYAVAGEAPAPVRLRILAFAFDMLILSLPFSVWEAATAEPTIVGQVETATTNPWRWLVYVAYFLTLETFWGASLGKRFFGLQLSPRSAPGWISRVARRTIVFHIPWLVIALVLVSFGPLGPASDVRRPGSNWTLKAKETRDLIESVATLTLVALLFVNARRRNHWSGLHDRVSGTHVVSRSSVLLRTRAAPVTPAADTTTPALRGPRYGPFIATTDDRAAGDHVVVGFDPVLRRHVWIHVVSAQTPPIGAVRRDVSRTGRLHWLTGRRRSHDNWDAFEAPDGQPLLRAIQGAPPQWSTLKSWLLDLATELVASTADGSTPPLQLDRLWIRDDGRLVLLDFPVPQLSPGPTPGLGPGLGGGLGGGLGARLGAGLSPVQLLAAVADRSRPSKSPQVLMPLSARAMLQSWSRPGPPSLSEAHAEIVRLAAAPDGVRRARRALPVALASLPPIFLIGFTTLVMLPTMNRFFNPDTREMLDLLEMLYEGTSPKNRVVDPEVRRGVEIYVAGRHGARLRDAAYWDSPMIQSVSRRLRKTAEDVAARHPSVSPEDLARAATTIAPELERLRQRRRGENINSLAGIIITTVTALALLFPLLVSLISSLIVPGGLLARMLGHAVVTRQGTEIGRLLSFTRVLVAWAPAVAWLLYLASLPKVQGFVPVPPNPFVGIVVTLVTLAAGACLTIMRPARGPHDWLLGTWMVPR